MKILYDISSAQQQGTMKTNGGGEYTIVLLTSLLEKKTADCIIDIASFNKYGECLKLEELKKKYSLNVFGFDDNKQFSDIINNGYDKIILPVCYSRYSGLKIENGAEIYTIIHDLCELYYPNLRVKYGRYIQTSILKKYYRKFKDFVKGPIDYKKSALAHKKICALSDKQKIITVTHFSKSTISYYLNVDAEKIMVFYTAEKKVELENTDTAGVMSEIGIEPKSFFLLMAGNRWAKNNAIVMKVLDDLFSDGKYDSLLKDKKVVLLGTDCWHQEFYRRFLKNQNRFILMDYIDDAKLKVLYENAHLLVFPSCLEGFGMPPLEAMEYGTVPACSTAMSIPEVCGDAAIYFDPMNEDSIKLAILRSFDSEFMQIMHDNGKKRYNWVHKKREEDLIKLAECILGK